MTGLLARNVVVKLANRTILAGVDADIVPGTVTAVVGPNGAGKSTLLKVLSGDIRPNAGTVTLNGRPLGDWKPEERALQRSVLPQTPELAFSFRARDVVELGRHPHRGRASSDDHHNAIQGAMIAAEIAEYAGRDCATLSGGELHRTHYARSLAQIWDALPDARPRFLLLDEPTSSLDLFHQHAILAKARMMAKDSIGVLAVLHDLNLAAAYADTLLILANGRVEAVGCPADVLTPERIRRVWRVSCAVIVDDDERIRIDVNPSAVPAA